jgi:molybdenum cofactor guanylyltransferase
MSRVQQPGIGGLILAGGAGTRVGGRDKGLIEIDGETLIASAIRHLRPQVTSLRISANRNLLEYAQLGYGVFPDFHPGLPGPLAGIAAALASETQPWLLTVPVDATAFPDDLAERLVDAALTQGARIAVVEDGERLQPLFALYAVELAEAAIAAVAADELAVWRFQQVHGAIAVRFEGGAAAFPNLNAINLAQ